MQDLDRLEKIADKLKKSLSLNEKIEVLNLDLNVKKFLESPSAIRTMLAGLSQECELILKSIIAIGQAENVFSSADPSDLTSNLRSLIEQLAPVEAFYAPIGGIVGYHHLMLKLLSEADHKDEAHFLPPEPIDISKQTREVDHWILQGIKSLGNIGELYAVGGAADRLNLHDAKGRELPAATMVFLGKTLLEWLIEDVAAREYVYYKLFGEQRWIPIAMMTSTEKGNHEHIVDILREHKWYDRGEENFILFTQPLVPTMDENGNWCLKGPMHLLVKPGGHGVIWKLAKERGVIDFLRNRGASKILVRQINNPIAGLDYGLLSFLGIGFEKNKRFGFASCDRMQGLAEGVNAITERKEGAGYHYVLTNVEYCDLNKFENFCHQKNSGEFFANTNILFADINAVLDAIDRCFVPGMLINLKSISYDTAEGIKKEHKIARLESTMQNVADSMGIHVERKLSKMELQELPVYLTYNSRKKTISPIKKAIQKGEAWLETPQGCAWDMLINMKELLQDFCKMKVPAVKEGEFSFYCTYHPALGPFYSLIGQKIRGGEIKEGSDLDLQIAELDMENFYLQGTIRIKADAIMGKVERDGKRIYSESSAKCYLKNVTVKNLGPPYKENSSWPLDPKREESLEILIHGSGEFFAEDITLEGNIRVEVPDGYRVRAYLEKDEVCFSKEKIDQPSWYWQYRTSSDEKIIISKKE